MVPQKSMPGYKPMAKKKAPGAHPSRDRVDLRADPEFIARLARQARRLGLNLSAYIRLRMTEAVERDESSDPSAH